MSSLFEYYTVLIGLGPFLLVLVLVVQLLLSKNHSPLWGWILPVVTTGLSLLFSMGVYNDPSAWVKPLLIWNGISLLFIAEFFIVRHFYHKGAWEKPSETSAAGSDDDSIV